MPKATRNKAKLIHINFFGGITCYIINLLVSNTSQFKLLVMKNFLFGIVTTCVVVAIFGFINNNKEQGVHEKEWIISPRF